MCIAQMARSERVEHSPADLESAAQSTYTKTVLSHSPTLSAALVLDAKLNDLTKLLHHF